MSRVPDPQLVPTQPEADPYLSSERSDTIQVINTPKADTTHAVFIVFVDHGVREWARDAINTPGFPERQAGLNPAPWSQLIRVRKPIKAQCYNGGPQLTQCLKRWNAVRGTNIHYCQSSAADTFSRPMLTRVHCRC